MPSPKLIDKVGRPLEVGNVVDILLNGMYQGQVVEVNDSIIMPASGHTVGPHILVTIVVPCFARPTGQVQGVYIVGDTPEVRKDNVRHLSIVGVGDGEGKLN